MDELLFGTGVVFFVTLIVLSIGEFSFADLWLAPYNLWIIYFIYALSGIILFHFIIFNWETNLAKSGRHLSKRLPKYLEYAYTLIVVVGLIQIFAFAPRMADYIMWVNRNSTADKWVNQ